MCLGLFCVRVDGSAAHRGTLCVQSSSLSRDLWLSLWWVAIAVKISPAVALGAHFVQRPVSHFHLETVLLPHPVLCLFCEIKL